MPNPLSPEVDELVTEFFLEYIQHGFSEASFKAGHDGSITHYFIFDDEQLLHLLPCLRHYWGMMITVDAQTNLKSKIYFDDRDGYRSHLASIRSLKQ